MMTLMPLILILVRIMNRRRFDQVDTSGGGFTADFFRYGEGLMATVGVLYVFLILSGLFCNQFAFEHGGMRSLVLAPIDRRTILVGKNIAISIVALIFSTALMIVNELVFRDLTIGVLLFVFLSFIVFMALMSMIGNSLSMRVSQAHEFGKSVKFPRGRTTLIPMIFVLALAPLAATAAGYVAQSFLVEYATLAVLAALSIVFYLLMINSQAESLQRRELEILEAVNDADND